MYQTKTFFEYISSADMELIHSQMISWILSEDFQGFKDGEKSRTKILNEFFGVLNPGAIKRLATEQSSIDILIELDHTVLCVENKIKSSQHSGQLKRYEDHVSNTCDGKDKKFYFLTLVEEDSGSELWVNKSYKELLEVLKSLKQEGDIADNFNGQLLIEYMITIDKLLSAVQQFLTNPASCPNVFQDGGLKKLIKVEKNIDCDLQRFIRANQLETLFQKLYFREVSKCLKFDGDIYITETNGRAILGCFLVTEKELTNGKLFHFGMDFQNGSFKTMCISNDYPNSKKQDMLEQVIALFEEIHLHHRQYGYIKRANKPKSRAQCSVTKPFYLENAKSLGTSGLEYWWGLTPEQFAFYFDVEIEVSRELLNNHILKNLNRDYV